METRRQYLAVDKTSNASERNFVSRVIQIGPVFVRDFAACVAVALDVVVHREIDIGSVKAGLQSLTTELMGRSEGIRLNPQTRDQIARKYGLNLSDDGFQACFELCKSQNVDKVVQAATALDLKKLSQGCFPRAMQSSSSGDRVQLQGPFFVQVIGCKNIAQPSIKQDSGGQRCLYIHLTDGHDKVYALEHVPIPGLSLKTLLPGTKLVLRNVVYERNLLLLEPRCVQGNLFWWQLC